MKRFLYTILLCGLSLVAFGQHTILGTVVDAENDEGLLGATVLLKGTAKGTIADFEGHFKIAGVRDGTYQLEISYLGYSTAIVDVLVSGSDVDMGTIRMKSDAIGLNEVQVVADIAIDRRTPVAVSKIDTREIEAKLGNQEFVEIMKMTPSIYTTKTSGGFGDSRINVRGFAQEDVALLINGIPVNGMEDNKVYWSNWAGLGDVTRTIQVQRGLGASKLAVASVGGTINILTKTTDQEKGGSVYAGLGNDGYNKVGATLSTGRTDDGWAFTVSGARTTGQGYIEGNYIDAWSYFFSVAKEIGSDHLLMLTGVGAPQRHGQRDFPHSISDLKNVYGTRWNDDYGRYRGQEFGWRENFYHKPQIGLSHIWDLNEKTNIVTSAYVSIGRGGGTGDIGSTREFFIPNDFRGHEDFDAIDAWNRGDGSLTTIFGDEDPVAPLRANGGDPQQILSMENGGIIKRASMNEHEWYGVLSTLNTELTDQINLSGGLDVRLYQGIHYRKTVDLLGGEYWFDQDNINNLDDWVDFNGDGERTSDELGNLVRPRNSASRLWGSVDDDEKIDYYNTEDINWYGVFGQAEYSNGTWSAFLSGAFNYTQMRRTDYFLEPDNDNTTDWLNFYGGNVKAGANYNIDANHNVFMNAGFISRAPYFDALFPTFDNDEPNEDAANETVIAVEAGYGYRGSGLNVNFNGYYTSWKDKTEVNDDFEDPDTGEQLYLNLQGVDATHMGLELDFDARLTRNLNLNGMVSLGNWEWSNDPQATVTDDNQQVVGELQLYLDGLKVADAAQTTIGLGADYEVVPGLSVDAQYLFIENLYSRFEPSDRDNVDLQGVQALKLPNHSLVDLGLSWDFEFSGMRSNLRVNINNLLDEQYISEAVDNVEPGDADINDDRNSDTYNERLYDTTGWFGFGRTWNATVKFYF